MPTTRPRSREPIPLAEWSTREYAILRRICGQRAVPEREILNGSSKFKRVVAARRQIMAELRDLGYSLLEISKLLGLDHSTVLYGLRMHDTGRRTRPDGPRTPPMRPAQSNQSDKNPETNLNFPSPPIDRLLPIR